MTRGYSADQVLYTPFPEPEREGEHWVRRWTVALPAPVDELPDEWGRAEGHGLFATVLPDDWVGYPMRKDYEFPREYHGISCE